MKRKLHIFLIITLSLVWLLLLQTTTWGTTYYVDPVNGDMNNDGSYEKPWKTLQEVFDYGLIRTTVQGGDTLKLRTGYHGSISEYGVHNDDYITIEPQAGHKPYLRNLNLLGASKWIIRGLTVSPELAPGDFVPVGKYISIENHNTWGESSNSIIENCVIYSMQDSSAWTIEEWNNLPGYMGINVEGPNHIVRNNTLKNVNFGIVAGGDNVLVENNTIINFAGDGLRVGGGKNQVWQYNTVKNCYDVSANHDDGLQVYTGGTEVHNLIIRGNYILEYEDPNQPFRGSLQGILCAQGPDTNFGWIVENNVVVVSWHGISIKDATNSKIVNNTVIRPPDSPHEEYYPQITLYSDENRIQYGSNTVIRNNMAGNFPAQDEVDGIIVDHNLDIDNYDLNMLFVDYLNLDFHLKQGSPAIDAGSDVLAPDTDIAGNPRPYGMAYDIGAYEYTLLPRVIISARPNQGYLPLTVLFGISEFITPNGEIEKWEWDFGDGATSQEKEPSHTYTSPGDYTVTLTVTDIQGYKGQAQTYITVLKKEKEFGELPTGCYNNVFNPAKGERALIVVELPNQARVKLDLYNTRGKRIRELVDEEKEAGIYKYYWDGKSDNGNVVGSGLYFVHIQAGDYKKTKKIVVVK